MGAHIMNRRQFSGLALAGVVGAAAPQKASYDGLGKPAMRWGIKHSMQVPNFTPRDLRLAKQLGMEYVNTWTSPDKYQDIVKQAEQAGLKVAKIGNGEVHNRAELVLGLPGRDEKIEEFKRNLRALAAAGIQYQLYAHMANGVWSTARETARGGADTRAFDAAQRPTSGGSSHDNVNFERRYTEDELWANWEYFARRIAPVAEETGVKIGIHCDDPPGLTLGNLPRPIFSSFEGYKRALEIANSPNIGMGLCVGCWLEGGATMGRNVLETIEYFGGLKKLFIIHYRNVHAPLPHFHETFLNEGYMDMYKIMKQLRKVNFDGVLLADHWPNTVGGMGQAYTIGYIQALIERANEEA